MDEIAIALAEGSAEDDPGPAANLNLPGEEETAPGSLSEPVLIPTKPSWQTSSLRLVTSPTTGNHAEGIATIELTETLLLLSRADQRVHPGGGQPVPGGRRSHRDPATPRGKARRHHRDLRWADPRHRFKALLLQLGTKLVHNAIVHNLPDHGNVWVTTTAHGALVELTVENTGEQLGPELVFTLAEPFLCGDERVRTDHAGVGLDLAIAQSITQAHDGTLTLAPRANGGLRVTVQLPASAAS